MKGKCTVTHIGGGNDPSLTQVCQGQGQVVQFAKPPPITMDDLMDAVRPGEESRRLRRWMYENCKMFATKEKP